MFTIPTNDRLFFFCVCFSSPSLQLRTTSLKMNLGPQKIESSKNVTLTGCPGTGHHRSPDLKNDTGTTISPVLGQQNKATHTHTAQDLRWFLACLRASFTVLMTLLLPLRRQAVVTTCLRKVKHRITAPLPVPWLAVPPLALTVSTRNPMFARMPPSWSGMPMSVRAL